MENEMKMETVGVDLKPKIIVIGIGGAGGNAVNNMIRSNLEGVTFIAANTDAQALNQSLVPPENRIQLGLGITQGLGAGSKPDVGKAAAEESVDEITRFMSGANMVFVTAGMGGGTGTGAAPVVARVARDSGILTVGVVTKPFSFEGSNRSKLADCGIEDLQQYVDTLLVIPNQNLFRLASENTTFADAFRMADNVLYSGVRGVTDLMIMPGLINLDFADIRAVMSEMGKAMMGTGEAEGDRRALDAAEAAISNPLLDDVSLQGASGVLINITGGYDVTLYEVDEAVRRVLEEVEPDAKVIFGSTFDERLNGRIRVSVVATGIGSSLAKSRDISSVVGLKKPKPQNVVDGFRQDETGFVDDIADSKLQEDELFFQKQEEEQMKNTSPFVDLSTKKKPISFFDRFRSRKESIGSEYKKHQKYSQQKRHAVNDDEQDLYNTPTEKNDDLEIPACFRKGKERDG